MHAEQEVKEFCECNKELTLVYKLPSAKLTYLCQSGQTMIQKHLT